MVSQMDLIGKPRLSLEQVYEKVDACANADDVHNLLLGSVVGDGEDFYFLAFCHLDGARGEELGGGEVVGVEAPALGGDVVVEVFVLEGRPCEGGVLEVGGGVEEVGGVGDAIDVAGAGMDAVDGDLGVVLTEH